MCAPNSEQERRSLSAVVANWREYDGSFSEKLRLALRNNWIKIRTRSECCGNLGEPGC
jgi:hypothetical protein